MDDLVKRQDAIDAIWDIEDDPEVISIIKSLPSAQKKGKWIVNSPVTMKCDQCGYVIADWKCKESNYCPSCGSRNRGEKSKWI